MSNLYPQLHNPALELNVAGPKMSTVTFAVRFPQVGQTIVDLQMAEATESTCGADPQVPRRHLLRLLPCLQVSEFRVIKLRMVRLNHQYDFFFQTVSLRPWCHFGQ